MTDDFIFFDAREYASNLRVTIQRSGKMGFSDFTQTKLKINETMSIRIGIDGRKDTYKYLLLQILDTVEPHAFKINKAGNYYYFNPKPLLDELSMNYKSKNILFEMIAINEQEKIYKLVKKEAKVDSA
jgi:hypothetical protein